MTVGLFIEDVPIEYQSFTLARYRGVEARPFTVSGLPATYDRIAKLFAKFGKDNAGKTVTVRITGPSTSGTNPQPATATMKLYMERLIKRPVGWMLVLYDARIRMRERVCALNFNVTYGGTYFSDTVQSSYRGCIQAVATAHLNDLQDGGFSTSLVNFVAAEDRIMTAGLTCDEAMAVLCAKCFSDPVVQHNGKIRFVSRREGAPSVIPGIDWRDPLPTEAPAVNLRPKKIVSNFIERHCILFTYTTGATSSVPDGTLLEQVYLDDGEYKTLEELLTDNGYASGAITDAMIARTILCNFQNTPLEPTNELANQRVRGAIQDGWRKLFRIEGDVGKWSDIVSGELQSDGTVLERGVDCKWAEVYQALNEQAGGSFIGAEVTKNHDAPSPLAARWDSGPENGVIRLVPTLRTDANSIVIPGEIVSSSGAPTALTVVVKSQVSDDEGNVVNLPGRFRVVEVEDASRARFAPSFTLRFYMTGTRERPEGPARWTQVEETGYSDGDIDKVELPPSMEVFALRDCVDPGNPARFAGPDGYGQLLNKAQIESEADRRAKSWKTRNIMVGTAVGVAESVMAFRDVQIVDAIREVQLHVELVNDAPMVSTVVIAGGFEDRLMQDIQGAKRTALRLRDVAGVRA